MKMRRTWVMACRGVGQLCVLIKGTDEEMRGFQSSKKKALSSYSTYFIQVS